MNMDNVVTDNYFYYFCQPPGISYHHIDQGKGWLYYYMLVIKFHWKIPNYGSMMDHTYGDLIKQFLKCNQWRTNICPLLPTLLHPVFEVLCLCAFILSSQKNP